MSMSGPPPVVPRRSHHHPPPSIPDRTFSPTSSTNSSVTSPPPEPPSSSSFVSNYSQSNNFGSCLQSSYEAISKRHEEELRALESLRGHVFKRQRADKEYAEQLGRINQSCERAAQFPSSTTSSIVQAWKVFLQISDRLQNQVSSSVDQMKGMLEVVDELIKNKRGAKKVCDDERVRLDTEFTNSCKDVQDLRRDYRKHLRNTEKCKNNLQGFLQKQAKQTDVDRHRSKFVSAAKKLHQCHNDYTLSVVNVNIHQDFYRQTLLPFCLDTLQQRMELQISEWKTVLSQYSNTLDMAKLYEDGFTLVNEALGQVEKELEYVQFIKDNVRDNPPIEVFEFDGSLLSAPCAPTNVDAGHVVVNNLTYDNLSERLQKLENDISQYQSDISEKEQKIEELQSSNDNATLSRRDSKALPTHVQIADLRAKVYELMEKKTRNENKTQLIREALGQLGDTTPPLFDPLGEGVDENQLTLSVVEGHKKKGKATETFRRFKNVFKGGTTRRGTRGSSNSDDMTGDIDDMTIEGGMDDDHYDDEEDTEYQEVTAELSIEEEDWYFGSIDRKEAESKCRSVGDFLVRFSDRQNKHVLTVHWNGTGRHFVIQEVPDPQDPGNVLYRFEDKAFAVIRDLLEYHITSRIPVTRNSGAVLSKFVSRVDKWAIRRQDLKLGRKLGRGAFGEVCEAVLLSNGHKVAVKTCRETIPDAEKRKFLQEAEILKQYDHPNIVQLIGVCAEKDPVFIIMELLPGGSFLDYLRKKGGLQTKKKLTVMVTDACAGMAYLESMKCIHRDLAARNCLVGENDIVKISDFGMSREEECGIYTVSSGSRAIPIKWTAPEALNLGRYTTACDVWSFGILLWETFSLGSTPYPGLSNNEAREQVEGGYRMPPPKGCPEVVYNLMQECWLYDEEERPQFADLHRMLQDAQMNVHD